MYVFALTTGHSGSLYLTQLLSTCPNTYVTHEPGEFDPEGRVVETEPPTGLVGDAHLGNPEPLRAWYAETKVQRVRNRKGKQAHYVEGGCMVAKGDPAYLLSLFPAPEVRVIHLRRDPHRTAQSLQAAGSIPGAHPWHGYPWSPLARLRWPQEREIPTPLVACVWGWLEVAALALSLESLYPVYHVGPGDLSNERAVLDLCAWAGLPPPAERSQVGSVVNAKLGVEAPTPPEQRAAELAGALAAIRAGIEPTTVVELEAVLAATEALWA